MKLIEKLGVLRMRPGAGQSINNYRLAQQPLAEICHLWLFAWSGSIFDTKPGRIPFNQELMLLVLPSEISLNCDVQKLTK